MLMHAEEISCQILSPGGSMGPRFVLQLLFCKKNANLLITKQSLKPEKDKIWNPWNFRIF
jgi:hypothetical protein